jgi:hypothetical protein
MTGGGPAGTASINIQVPYQFVFLKPFMHWSDNKASITLQSTFVMRNE